LNRWDYRFGQHNQHIHASFHRCLRRKWAQKQHSYKVSKRTGHLDKKQDLQSSYRTFPVCQKPDAFVLLALHVYDHLYTSLGSCLSSKLFYHFLGPMVVFWYAMKMVCVLWWCWTCICIVCLILKITSLMVLDWFVASVISCNKLNSKQTLTFFVWIILLSFYLWTQVGTDFYL
jgi:hypothetical protein